MYEDPEQSVKSPTSISENENANGPSLVKIQSVTQQENKSIAETNKTSVEDKSNEPNLIVSDDEKSTIDQTNELKIVAVESAVAGNFNKVDDDGKGNVETTDEMEHESELLKSSDEHSDTRVISLDTIIRKGLNEQMPMTAKDIDNIVPNAIKQQQDTNLKQSEMAKEKELHLVYETSDEYENTSEDEVVQADVQTHKEPDSNEHSANSKADDSDKEKVVSTIELNETPKYIENENHLLTKSINNLSEDTLSAETSNEKRLKDANDVEIELEVMTNSANSNDSNFTSDQSFDEFGSETDTTHSSRKKTRRRKSSTTTNKLKEGANKKNDGVVDETREESGRKLNRRGKPRKSYDESDTEETKKKIGRKLKIQRYSGPKRPPGRPKRDDGLGCYKDLNPTNAPPGTTPMDELMALGHSLVYEFAPKKLGRPKRESFVAEINAETETEATKNIAPDNIVQIHHNIDDQSTHPQLMFKRKPGRPKIDKESGGHIVFQNSELTVVNKPTKIKGEIIEPQDENGLSMVHSKDISILPIIKSSSVKKDLSRSYNLPAETTITSYGNDRSYNDANIRSLKKDPGYIDDSMLMAPLDEMLEVHHVEEYIPETYDGHDKRKRGRKPKMERSTYSELTLSEPYALNSDRPLNKPSNGSGIQVKKIEDLLEIPTRKPTLQDFSYPELTVSTTNKSLPNSNSRLNPMASELVHRAINKRISGNRLSGNKPTYTELSESSNDVPDNAERSQLKPRKIHWKQQKKIKAAAKPHWTAQLKTNLKKAADENNEAKKIVSPGPDTKLIASTPPITTEKTPSDSINPVASSTPKTEVANKEFDKSVKELLQTRQKRIPKLKYSTYDFKVRRDPNKPKMVLKFKRKYYKKKKSGATTPTQSQDSTGAGTSNFEPASIPQTEETPIKIHKKPGPKPKPKLTIQSNQSSAPTSKSAVEQIPTTSKEPERIKRKYVRKQLPSETHQDDSIPASSDGVESLPNTKRKPPANDDTNLDSTTPSEQTNKRLKLNKANDSNDQDTSKNDLESYNKKLQDRNHVLLEILEQRSAEIRNLKLQVSNMTKSDDEMKSTEKKDTTDDTWSPVELSKAYSLQKLSKSFYAYVQDRFSPPLPSSIDIDRFIDSITITKGLLTSMMQILEFDGETMTDVERVTILQISQLKMESVYEYDDNSDNIVGPHSSMTVVVAKGLYSDWKQAVYLNFDMTKIKSILNMIIEELHKIKFSVVACVCKYVDGESSIWNEYGIGMGCNYFPHPVTTEFIYTFYYIDDLILSIRNNFVANGFMTDTCRINMSPLVELINIHDLRLPIRSETLTTKCENISDIVELFSKQTSNLLRLLMPSNELATNLADFCKVLSSFYQLMDTDANAMITTDDSNCKLPYGSNLEYQNDILNETQLHFYKLRCPGVSKMSEFQRATMLCIESLKMLQHSTKQKYKIDSFGTRNITKEYLKTRLLNGNNSNISSLTPIKSMGTIKDIFLQAKSAESLIYETTVKLFFDDEIDPALPESHYVDLLIKWIADKYEKKQANSNIDDFNKKMHKFEELFQSIQNPQFKIIEDAVTKVFKKLKSQTYGMFLEVIHTFVVQRHLLRIKYLNAVTSKNAV